MYNYLRDLYETNNTILLLFIGALATACDPDWALNPQNEGYAYVINNTGDDITYESYLFNGNLATQHSIAPRDTVYVACTSWDERMPNWDKIVKAGWDPFLDAIAGSDYDGISEELFVRIPTIKIITSPTNTISWTLDMNNIEEDSIFNEANWTKEISNDGYHTFYSWYYTIE